MKSPNATPALPGALASWGRPLAIFPPDVATAVGALVPRLASLIGPLRPETGGVDGVPDGFDGLARRGPPERLLATEWLLADELPDEFVRRALAGEQTYLALARRAPRSTRASVALFDAGPDQLGAPRLAHLAALVVLARRAEKAGAAFRWGVAGRAPKLVDAVDGAAVRRLLAARSAERPTPADVDAALDALARDGLHVEDVFLVGGGAFRADGRSESRFHLELVESLAAETPYLEARLSRGARPLGHARLPLPPDDVGARVLRDPFQSAAASPARLSTANAPASPLVFSTTGGKLLALTAAGRVIAYPIPNSPREKPGKPKFRGRDVGRPFALDYSRRQLFTIGASGDELHLAAYRGAELAGHDRFPFSEGRTDIELADAPALRPCVPFHEAGVPNAAFFVLDDASTLFVLRRRRGPDAPPRLAVQARCVLALARAGVGVSYVSRGPEPRPEWNLTTLHDRGGHETRGLGPDVTRVFFGSGSHQGPLVAVEGSAGWRLLSREGTEHFVGPVRVEIVGAVERWRPLERPSLVVLDDDRRRISFEARAGAALPAATAPIRSVFVGSNQPYVAYITEAAELVVFSLWHWSVVLRLFLTEER